MRRCRSRCLLVLAIGLGCWVACAVHGSGVGRGSEVPPHEPAPVLDFSEHFEYEPLSIEYGGPSYGLPLDSGHVGNLRDVAAKTGLSPATEASLLENGFVVADFNLRPACENVAEAYDALAAAEVPIFVTSASLLHTYHILFDKTLSSIEARVLFDDVWRLASTLLDGCLEVEREASGDLREAASRDAAFLAVGLALLAPEPSQIGSKPAGRRPRMGEADESGDDFVPADLERYALAVPEGVAEPVGQERSLISRHAGFAPSPIFCYAEDYSQYVPRGHYTASEKLKNYFKAMMWFGRMSMLIRGSETVARGGTCATCDGLISEYDARIQTLGACLIASLVGRSDEISVLWDRVYAVAAFFVGFSDDLGPYEYLGAMDAVLGAGFDLASFGPEHQAGIKARLAEHAGPRIYGGTGKCEIQPPFSPKQADECLEKTRGFRLMGQRFVPDSYAFSRLVAPRTGEFTGSGMPFTAAATPAGVQRAFPRGLDLMALLGSERARSILHALGDTDYELYAKAFGDLKLEIDGIEPARWNQNLYWNWLWVLRALLAQHGDGFPSFMRTEAWDDRLLNLGLASWSELRHDTILYTKQSYTMMLTGAPVRAEVGGYVEPVPEVYNRLLSLTRMMRLGLGRMAVIDDAQTGNLERLEATLQTLVSISAKELRGEPLDEADRRFIDDFGDRIDGTLQDVDETSKKTTLIADVHTDTNTGQVLEEATGYVDLIVVAWRGAHGISLAAGPELSYFEFKQPIEARLTDEAWRERLAASPPARPGWIPSARRTSPRGMD